MTGNAGVKWYPPINNRLNNVINSAIAACLVIKPAARGRDLDLTGCCLSFSMSW